MKFFKNWYLGWSKDRDGLGFLTPSGTNTAALKRKKTVDSWSNKGSTTELNMNPMKGFYLNGVRGNTGISIVDPRGYRLELKENAVNYLILNTTIIDGFIIEPCVWMRSGPDNYLVPTSSNEFKTAMNNMEQGKTESSTSSVKKKLSAKEMIPGQVYSSNKTTYMFLGKVDIDYNRVDVAYENTRRYYGRKLKLTPKGNSELLTGTAFMSIIGYMQSPTKFKPYSSSVTFTKNRPTVYQKENVEFNKTIDEIISEKVSNISYLDNKGIVEGNIFDEDYIYIVDVRSK